MLCISTSKRMLAHAFVWLKDSSWEYKHYMLNKTSEVLENKHLKIQVLFIIWESLRTLR